MFRRGHGERFLTEEIKAGTQAGITGTHAHSSFIHGSPEAEATQVSLMDERIKEMWSIHTVEYYSASERKGTLTPATTQMMNPEDFMLSGTSQ